MKGSIVSICISAVLFFTTAVSAMPSQKEINEVQPLVSELLKPSVAAFKAKKMSGSEVGDTALKLAEDAEGEAAMFLCMKGAVTYYVRDKEYDKAADTIESIMAKFKDMPPETLQGITSSAAKGVSAKSAPRLIELNRAAGRQVANEKKLKSLRKQLKETPADKAIIRQYAEINAANGNWEEALTYFAKLGGEIGKMAKEETEGNASAATLAGFWWDYKAQDTGAKDAIRRRAAEHYQEAIDNGELKGLNKTLAENRIAEAETSSAAQSSNASKLKKYLIHRWSFSGDLKDSVGKNDAKTVNGNVTFEKGQVRLHPDGGYVDLGANVIPSGGEDEYTIEIWATKYSIQSWARVIHVQDNWGWNDYYWSWNSGTEPTKWLVKLAGIGNCHEDHKDGTGIGVENHFVIVYGHNKDKKAYYDMYILRGGKVYWHRKENNIPGSMFKSHTDCRLGRSPKGSDKLADASYNEVRIWKRALTEDEIMRSSKLGPDKLP